MSKPPKFDGEYERVRHDDFVKGVIEEIQEEPEHEFPVWKKGADGKSVKTGTNKFFGIRFKFSLEGYKFPKYSRWMKFLYSELSTLYNKYIANLVEGATPNMDLDIQDLKGMEVKTLWDNKDFQGLVTIMPASGVKMAKTALSVRQDANDADTDSLPEDDEIPPHTDEELGF